MEPADNGKSVSNGMLKDNILADAALNKNMLMEKLPFQDLSEAQARELLDLATIRHVAANDTVFDEGDDAEHFYVMIDGFLRVVRTTQDGDQVVVLHIAPGQMFGIAKAFDSDSYTATAKAASKGLALCWPSDLWETFVKEYPGFQSATRKAIGTRMEELQDKIVSMATQQVEKRIAHAILRLLHQAGKTTDDGIEIDFPLTRQDISEMTGTTLHSVSRHLSNWQKKGIVFSQRRRIIVRQPEALPV